MTFYEYHNKFWAETFFQLDNCLLVTDLWLMFSLSKAVSYERLHLN